MTASEREWREIGHNSFGPDAFINQGNLHVHLPLPPAPAKVVRVIPYLLNEDLVYRKEVVDQLDKLLPPLPGFYNAALWGLGGSGKTQIALDYAYRRCVDDECCVLWVHADSEATFTSDYKAIGKKLGIGGESLDGPELLSAVRDGIEAQPRWVLILDNADDLGLFGVGRKGGSLANFIPGGLQGTILWTSRDGRITGSLVGPSRGIEVPSMTKDEAISLLEMSMSDNIKSGMEDAEIDRLLEELQLLPLAVSQAGVYMRRTRTPVKEYLNLLLQGTSRWDLLKINDSDRHRRPEVSNSVLETWKISIERIREESKLSYRILHVIAYLDNQDIPHQLIQAAGQGSASSQEDENVYRRNTDLEVLQAVTRLVEFSFLHTRRVEEGQRSYEMHKLVQEAIRYGLRVQQPDKSPLGESTALTDSPQNTEVYFSAIALEIVNDAFENAPLSGYYYIPHAIQVGEWAEVNGKEVETAALLCRVSAYMNAYGRWREVELVDRKVINLRTKALGEKHLDTIEGMATLVETLIKLGRYSEAEKLAEQVLELRRQSGSLCDKHPKMITSMAYLAMIHQCQARHDEAERLTEQVLSLQREVIGDDHPDTVIMKENLALIYLNQVRYKEAEVLIKQTLDVRREILGEKHPATIGSISQLATILKYQDRYDDSEKLAKQALALYQEVLGSHPDTFRAMADLAEIYTFQGRYAESEKLNKQVLSLQLRDLGDEHPYTLKSMDLLAVTYIKQGRYDDSETLMEKVLGRYLEICGGRYPITIRSMRSLATAYYNNGRYTKSEKLLDQALKHQLEISGEKHPNTIMTMMSLATIYHAQGRYTEAEKFKEQALRLMQEVFDEGHPDMALAMGSLAETYDMQGRHDDAERLKEQALTLQLKILGEKHPDTIRTMGSLSITYHYQRRLAEAEKLKKQTLKLRQEILGTKHPDTINTMASLGQVYISQGRWLDAQGVLEEARILQVEILGEKHPDTIKSQLNYGILLYKSGQHNKAKSTFVMTLDLQRELLGDKHPNTLLNMARLAQCWRHIDPGEAKKILIELLQVRREVNGDEHADTIQTMEDLAACEEDIRNKDSRQVIRQQRQGDEQMPGRDDNRNESLNVGL
ncbi:kinesin light chain [Trichoderma asperellum]|uniref:Kinesin light chain n=1 Tax=Trichoderma asperellum TaxID=101201 RepID=A0A6V8R4J3_TRIAP|nr:kinesin light chain [Trichoderma asperellum]